MLCLGLVLTFALLCDAARPGYTPFRVSETSAFTPVQKRSSHPSDMKETDLSVALCSDAVVGTFDPNHDQVANVGANSGSPQTTLQPVSDDVVESLSNLNISPSNQSKRSRRRSNKRKRRKQKD